MTKTRRAKYIFGSEIKKVRFVYSLCLFAVHVYAVRCKSTGHLGKSRLDNAFDGANLKSTIIILMTSSKSLNFIQMLYRTKHVHLLDPY